MNPVKLNTLEGRILAVVHEARDFRLLEGLIRDSGSVLELDHGASADSALTLLAGTEYEAIILDCQLGEENGLAVLRRIRQQGADAPILFLTNESTEELDDAAYRGGAADCLVKSRLTPDLLAAAIRYAVQSQAQEWQRKRAEEHLRAREERFRTLVENSVDALQMLDPAGKVVYSSFSVERILGFSVRELLGSKAIGLVHPDDRATVRQKFAYCLTCPELPVPMAYRNQHKDGSWIQVEATAANYLDKPGIAAIVLNFRNVSERRRTEDALQNSEARFRQVVESNACGMVFRNIDGVITDANDAFLKILGFTREELGQGLIHWMELTPEEFRPAEAKAMEQLKASRTFAPFEKEFFSKEGTRVPVTVGGSLLQGSDTEGFAFVIDDTERNRTKDRLRQSQKLEALGRLAGGVAHDFNNLLNIIMGYSELLQERVHDDRMARRYALMIVAAIRRGAALTSQLLAFSRNQVISPKVIRLESALSEMSGMLQRLIGEDIGLTWSSSEGLWQVKADPAQMDQLVVSLAVNARESMPDGGQLRIEMSNLAADESWATRQHSIPAGEYVRLTISDSGKGLDPEEQARIFEPSFADEGQRAEGIGLATVYGIVKQSNGFIFVDSQPGAGTKFSIYLPRTLESPSPESSRPAGHSQSGHVSGTVLLAEDEGPLREPLKEYLESKGYKVLVAENGDAALRIEGQFSGKIDLLLTDVIMPGIRGKQLAEMLLSRRPDMRVLYMSGYTDQMVLGSEESDPGFSYIRKPFSLAALAEKIQELLSGSDLALVANS